MKLTGFKVLTFDCYGTLIDWESGILAALGPLLARASRDGAEIGREAALERFAHHESGQEAATPGRLYPEILAAVHRLLAAEWGVASTPDEDAAFGASVPAWPAFADSTTALQYLAKYYRLVILSNVDRASFAASARRLGVAFDAVFTAEEIGSYKPDAANFRFMLERLGARGHAPGEILHTAQSLFHDHAPAGRFGLARAWIDRRHDRAGWGATMAPPDEAAYEFHFRSLAEMMKAHQEELRA